ncbi:MAG: 7TM domain-containing protein [Candidatus Paceibacterota bacterium]
MKLFFIGWMVVTGFFFGMADLQAEESEAVVMSEEVGTSTQFEQVVSSTVSHIQEKTEALSNKDVTKPEELPEKVAILSLFSDREVTSPNPLNFMAYWVQKAVQMGIPANTIFLILLTPLLATIVSFARVVVGIPTLDMLVPIALSFVFIAVGVTVGMLVLGAIILASYLSKMTLSRVRVMFYPKRSLSFLFLAIFVFATLTIAVSLGFAQILSLSIFPILVLMLLGDSIVSVQLLKSTRETFAITASTIGVGLVGYLLASSEFVRNTLILYPELVFLAIPINLMIGRYFGLRLTEFFRFNTLSH